MLIIIYGEDTYRSREWLHELVLKFKEKFDPQGYNVASFTRNSELAELRSAITAPPFLGTKRMVVCERLFEAFGKNENLETLLTKIPESTVFIVWEEGDEKTFSKTPLFAKYVREKTTKCYPFPLLRSAEIEVWARKRAKDLGVTFGRGALPELIGRVGQDLWQLGSELEKFVALKTEVTVEMVREAVRGSSAENIFAFTDALAAGDAKRAIQELANERANGAAVPYLITMLARQFRLLREAQDYLTNHKGATPGELAEVFGWHPFVAKKTAAQARAFQPDTLARACDALFDADRAVKTGIYDADTALDRLVAQLLGVTEMPTH